MRDCLDKQQEQIDSATSASVCNAIGERLRRNLELEAGALPGRLKMLLDEMQRQDREISARS